MGWTLQALDLIVPRPVGRMGLAYFSLSQVTGDNDRCTIICIQKGSYMNWQVVN